jgi:hypothetical protein
MTTGTPTRKTTKTTKTNHSPIDAFERRMTRLLSAVAVAIVVAVALLLRFWA